MKKFISVILCVCICLSSTAFCFASATSWDTSDQSNLSNASSKLNSINNTLTTVSTTLSTISSRVLNIYNSLQLGNHNITYYVEAILSWMNPIYSRLEDILQATTDPMVNAITGMLGYPSTDSSSGVTTWNPYLLDLKNALANVGLNSNNISQNSHSQLNMDGNYYFPLSIPLVNGDGQNYTQYIGWNLGSPLGNIAVILKYMLEGKTTAYMETYHDAYSGNSVTQTYYDSLSLNTASFTPTSMTNGIYTWLSKIQQPAARLAYVLASPERIAAQEAAADNEEAVVDNFIDSSGSGSASTSDIGSVSDLSSGFKNNINTDASVSGIWNIFNSDNFGWFSQETADQLDTTSSGTRTLKGSRSYPTPLLDQQTKDILKYLGGENND